MIAFLRTLLHRGLTDWIGLRSIFTLLLLTTIGATFLLSYILIASLQQIADEHPRRFLTRLLFQEIVNQAKERPNQIPSINGTPLVQMTAEEAERSNYATLFEKTRNDKDGIVIETLGDYFAAAHFDGALFTVLPRFGEPLSLWAVFFLLVVFLTAIRVIVSIYRMISRLTRPFAVLSDGIAQIENRDLSYRLPTEKAFGEFRKIALCFNSMVAEVQRIHEARRHMLLALPHELLTPLGRLKVRKELIEDEALRLQIGKDISVVEKILSSILAAEKGFSRESITEPLFLLPYAKEQIAQQLEEGHPIRLYNETGEDTAFFDPFPVGVLLRNFVSNAVRYGNGKPITVVFERVQHRPNAIRMSVQDQGIGIAAEQLPYLTEPFWRADESRARATGGHGLGLYLCQAIAQSLGSAIEIESRLGHGTRISVIIPQC